MNRNKRFEILISLVFAWVCSLLAFLAIANNLTSVLPIFFGVLAAMFSVLIVINLYDK